MIPTCVTTFDGVTGIIVPADSFWWPKSTFRDFPSCCGAGMTDPLVPETMWGLNISPACWVHDRMFEQADKTWADFFQANEIFEHNLETIIDQKSRSRVLKMLRRHRAHIYAKAVYIFGANYFFDTIMEDDYVGRIS